MKSLTKKIVSTVALLAVASAALAENITFTNLSSPGGGTDQSVQGLGKALELQGHKVTYQYVKSCADGISQVNANPENHLLVITLGDMILSNPAAGGDKCPPMKDMPVKLSMFTPLKGAPTYLCTSPGFAGTDWAKIKAIGATGQKLRIGTTAQVHGEMVKKMFEAQLPDIKMVILPFVSTPSLRLAATSGDIDMYTGSSLPKDLLEKGSKCIARSERNADALPGHGVLPFYGELEKGKPVAGFQETASIALLLTAPQTTAKVKTSIVSAFASPEFRTSLVKNGVDHRGLGDGVTYEQTMKDVVKFEQNYVK